tara:strand:+ start:268 stop:495 length:228 start_codon:yes stop_codon:yes gene_type:complete
MEREQAVTVYWDDHLNGHAFIFRKPNSHKVIVSDGVYDDVKDAETSAWLCCFATKDELDMANFTPTQHSRTRLLT